MVERSEWPTTILDGDACNGCGACMDPRVFSADVEQSYFLTRDQYSELAEATSRPPIPEEYTGNVVINALNITWGPGNQHSANEDRRDRRFGFAVAASLCATKAAKVVNFDPHTLTTARSLAEAEIKKHKGLQDPPE